MIWFLFAYARIISISLGRKVHNILFDKFFHHRFPPFLIVWFEIKKYDQTKIEGFFMYKNNHRIRIIFAFICLALFGIILYFIYFMVSKNNFYQSEYERLSNQYLYGWTAPRGRILDVNGNVLVDNEAVSVLAYSKSSSTTVTKEVELAKKLTS